MVKLTINKNICDLVTTRDFSKGEVLFVCTWFEQSSENPFYLPKHDINVDDVVSTDDLFIKVALSGFGEYAKPNASGNTNPLIDFDKKEVYFVANKSIKKGETVTYSLSPESFPHVTIQ